MRGNTGEPLSKRLRGPMLAAAETIRPQAPECSQLILGIVEALRQLERIRPGRAGLRDMALDLYQARPKCCMELNLAAHTYVRSGFKTGERPSDAPATLDHKR